MMKKYFEKQSFMNLYKSQNGFSKTIFHIMKECLKMQPIMEIWIHNMFSKINFNIRIFEVAADYGNIENMTGFWKISPHIMKTHF